MTSLMSVFDPSLALAPQSGWFVILVSLMTMKFGFWRSSSPSASVVSSFSLILLDLFKYQKVIFVAMLLFILNMNIAGLLPLVFSPTSHLSFNLAISLSLWLGMMGWYAWNGLGPLLSHLTPQGAPMALAPALVLIELVSSLIRPITLSLRLMANVMAGHMILTLISKGVSVLPWSMTFPVFSILVGFLLFEFGVALIQSYVFTSLMSLYWEESEKPH